MNLEAAMSQVTLQKSEQVSEEKRDRLGIAKMVFDMAASTGEPYENQSYEDWARAWLPSKVFHLVQIKPTSAAVPYVNRISPDKIQSLLAQTDKADQPIVVDLNKQGIGMSNSGFTPKIIVVDGKNRHRTQVIRGKDRVWAWVGEMAMAAIRERELYKPKLRIKASIDPMRAFFSTGDSINQLYAAIAPTPGGMTRQDTGDGGGRPTGGTPVMKGYGGGPGAGLGGGSGMNPTRKGLEAQNSRSTGQLEKPDPSDLKGLPDPSDRNRSVPDPSDRLQWKPDDPQLCAPGCGKDHQHHFGIPGKDSPGSGGSYTRTMDKGASNSEFSNPDLLKAGSDVEAGPVRVKKIGFKNRNLDAVAPPGREAQVKKLKQKFGTKSAFKIAWSQYNK